MRLLLVPVLLVAATACGGDDDDAPATTAYFDLDGPLAGAETYWNLPFPSDLRLLPSGAPDLAGYPNPRRVPIVEDLISVSGDRRGWPLQPIGYVRFTQPVPARAITDVLPAGDPAAILIDIDPASPERGAMYPIVASVLPEDPFVPSNLVAFAPRPGIVLRPHTRYAYVVRTGFAPGFVPPPAFAALAAGDTPAGARGAAAAELFAPLWPTLETAGIPASDVVVATVFTTGDEIAHTHARSEAVRAAYSPAIEGLTLHGGDTYDGFCTLRGTITMPQFQAGTPPFDDEGRFVLDDGDRPQRQRDETIPVTITIPKQPMPAAGWPLHQWIHGSGGDSLQVAERGPTTEPGGTPTPGKGPGYVVALHGLAAASTAMPVNPERVPNATDYAYLNISNLVAFPYTFQQGVFEQRLFLDALLALRIPHALLDGCGVPAPAGSAEHFFDPDKVTAGGQSMGGMYTNMTAAVEPRWRALVPTGAGGMWNLMILETELIPGALSLIAGMLGVDEAELVFTHPALSVLALGWEAAEPVAYMARVNRRPLPGHGPRHVYQSVPEGDENFTTTIYDAAALAYGNQQAGDVIWPTLQDALALDGLDGVLPYPVSGNRDGTTAVAVQFEGDGIVDPHYIFAQLDEVKHQYGCFLESFVRDGVPTVPAPGGLTDPCP